MIVQVGNISINVPEDNAMKQDWKNYLLELRRHFPRYKADQIWLYTWNVNGSFSYTTDNDFNSWFEKKGIEVPSDSAKAIAAAKDAGEAIAGFVGGLFNVMRYAVPVVTGIVVLIVLYFLYNVARKGDVTDVAAFTPVGRGAKAAKMLR